MRYMDSIAHAERARRFAESETGRLQARLDDMGIEYVQGWHDEETGEYVAERGSTSIDVDGTEYTFCCNSDGTFELTAYVSVEQAAGLAKTLVGKRE